MAQHGELPAWVEASGRPATAQASTIPRVVTIAPYWETKPPSGMDWYFNKTGVLPAGAGGQVILGPAFRTLANYRGVIASVTIFIDAITVAWDGVFQVRLSGGPVPGLDKLTSFPRGLSNFSQPYGANVIIQPQTTVDCLVINNGATSFTVGIELAGWTWPVQDELQTFGRLA